MKRDDIREAVMVRRASIIDFLSGGQKTTQQILNEYSGTSRMVIMFDLRELRQAGGIIRVAPATYAVRRETDAEEHPFVRYKFTDADRWKCGITKRERLPLVAELYMNGISIKEIAERFDRHELTIRTDLIELGIWSGRSQINVELT